MLFFTNTTMRAPVVSLNTLKRMRSNQKRSARGSKKSSSKSKFNMRKNWRRSKMNWVTKLKELSLNLRRFMAYIRPSRNLQSLSNLYMRTQLINCTSKFSYLKKMQKRWELCSGCQDSPKSIMTYCNRVRSLSLRRSRESMRTITILWRERRDTQMEMMKILISTKYQSYKVAFLLVQLAKNRKIKIVQKSVWRTQWLRQLAPLSKSIKRALIVAWWPRQSIKGINSTL